MHNQLEGELQGRLCLLGLWDLAPIVITIFKGTGSWCNSYTSWVFHTMPHDLKWVFVYHISIIYGVFMYNAHRWQKQTRAIKINSLMFVFLLWRLAICLCWVDLAVLIKVINEYKWMLIYLSALHWYLHILKFVIRNKAEAWLSPHQLTNSLLNRHTVIQL